MNPKLIFQEGDYVGLCYLQKETLNGRKGHVLGFDERTSRFIVQLVQEERLIKVRAINISRQLKFSKPGGKIWEETDDHGSLQHLLARMKDLKRVKKTIEASEYCALLLLITGRIILLTADRTI